MFSLGGGFTGSGPEMTINWHIDNHFSTLATCWSYRIDDDDLPRLSFETFATSVPNMCAAVKIMTY